MGYNVYGSPVAPIAPVPDPWSHLEITWTGWDGSVWSLCGGRQGQAISLQSGARGFTFPPIEEHTSSSPNRAGQRFRSHRELPREVFWPLMVSHGSGSKEWLEWDGRFRRSMRFDRPGMCTVRQPETGVSRSIMLRPRSDGDPSWYASPGLMGWGSYEYTLVADQPLWLGAPVRSPLWRIGDPVPFTGEDDAAPTYYLSKPNLLATASMTNPGDVARFPTWTLKDQIDAGAVVGVNGFHIGVPFAIDDGQTLVINTETGGARLDGVRVGNLLNPREFEPIPDGEEVPVDVTFSGAGSVQASLVPAYYAAWG